MVLPKFPWLNFCVGEANVKVMGHIGVVICHSVEKLVDASIYNRHSILDMVLVIRFVRFTI